MIACAAARVADANHVTIAGVAILLDASGVATLADGGVMVVSDLHLEKGSAYAARGTLIPPYDTAVTLKALDRAIAALRPKRIIALGDSFHDGGALDRIAPDDLAALAALQAGRDWVWIEGNHDGALRGRLPGDHAVRHEEAGLVFVHEPSPGPVSGEVCGHLHPAVKVRGPGRNVRRRAFVTDGRRLVMPAFGALTGGLNVCDAAISDLFPDGFVAHAAGGDRVYAISDGRCAPDYDRPRR